MILSRSMSLESWCSLLTLDPFIEICRTLGCSPETEDEQVAIALNQSIHFDSSVVPSTMSSEGDRNLDFLQISDSPCRSNSSIPLRPQRDGFAPPVSALWEKTKGDLVSSSILNPYLLRSVLKSEELESMYCLLVETRRSVRDMQAVLLLQLAQIAAAHGPPSLSSALSHRPSHPPPHRYLFLTLTLTLTTSGSFVFSDQSKLQNFISQFFSTSSSTYFILFCYFSQVLPCSSTSTQSA